LRSLIHKLFPGGSKRRFIARTLYLGLKSPVKTLKRMNRIKIKNFIRQVLPVKLKKNKIVLLKYSEKEKIVFSKEKNPQVSIIIPVYNQFEYTYNCLLSIKKSVRKLSYEIILADDRSSDETQNASEYFFNINLIRNKSNLGFLRNCNYAAEKAKGKYIVFLNNDTQVQEYWLESLFELMEREIKIGLAGSKLVYPDGRLQEAGGIIWKDGSGWNFGRLDDPNKPEYNYVKEVDYISGASIMVRTSVWKEIGGFDQRYIPAYAEDSDLAFEIRKHGHKVVFQPKSVVVHFEGISHGTDVNSGVKSYQIENQKKMIDKWKSVFEKEQFENAEHVFWARDRSRGKKTILVIDHYVPHFDQDAGSRTAFQYLKLFVEMGMNVKFIGDNFYPHQPYTEMLEQMGIEVLYGVWYSENWKKWIVENSQYIDFVYLNRPHITEKYIDFMKENTKAKILYNGVDFAYIREIRKFKLNRDKEFLENARKSKKLEFNLFEKTDIVLTISEYEKWILSKKMPDKKVYVFPTFIYEKTPLGKNILFEDRKWLTFVGGFTHQPNEDGLLWFVEEIFPIILNSNPNIILKVVGSNPTKNILKLKSKNIDVKGFVSDEELEEIYDYTKVVIAPLRYGAGVKGKIIEAISYAVPVVSTSIGIEGIQFAEELFSKNNQKEQFAQSILQLYKDKYKWNEIRKKEIKYAEEYLSFKKAEIIFNEILK